MSDTNKSVLDIIKSIQNLKISENEEEAHVTFTGILLDKSIIEINIHLSIAPSLQSLLSRMGNVYATLLIRINGNTAMYESEMSKKDMNEVGGFLSNYHREIQKQLNEKAYKILQKNISQ